MTPREKMIATTIRMFQRDGYRATSWRKLVEASGAPWGSAHHYFPGGKEQLGVAAVALAAEQGAARIRRCFADGASAAEGVARFFETTATGVVRTSFEFGCPIATVALEMSADSVAITTACDAAFALWRDALREGLAAGGVRPADAGEVATVVMATFEGCLLLARTTRSPDSLRAGAEAMQLLINARSTGAAAPGQASAPDLAPAAQEP